MLHFSKTYGTEFEARAGQSRPRRARVVERRGGRGHFGVWEVTSSDAHFELLAGGPCRLVPLTGDVPQRPSVRQLPPIARDGRFVPPLSCFSAASRRAARVRPVFGASVYMPLAHPGA